MYDFRLFPGDKVTLIHNDSSIPGILEGYDISLSGCTLRIFVDDVLVNYSEEVSDVSV